MPEFKFLIKTNEDNDYAKIFQYHPDGSAKLIGGYADILSKEHKLRILNTILDIVGV